MRFSVRSHLVLAGAGWAALWSGLTAAPDIPAGLPPLRVFTAHDTGVSTTGWSIAQDRDGTMYFGCNTVIAFNGDHWLTEPMAETYLVRGLDVGPDGRIWAAGVNQLGWFDRDSSGDLAYHSLLGYLPKTDPNLGEIWRAYGEADGGAYFVLRDQVLHWNGQTLQRWRLPGQNILWASRTARALYVHHQAQGLLRLTPAGPAMAITSAQLHSAEVRWLDDGDAAWFLVTNQGIGRWHDGRYEPIESPASRFIQAYAPTSVVALGNGSLAIGSLRGGVAVISRTGEILQRFDRRGGLPSDQIYALCCDREGALWGAGPAYIFRLGLPSGATLYRSSADYPAGGADALTQYNDRMYLASPSGLRRLEADPASGRGHWVELPPSGARIYSVLSTVDGLMVATLNGLDRWTEHGLEPLRAVTEAVFRMRSSAAHPGQILASLRDRVVLVDPVADHATVVADGLPDYGDSIAVDLSGRLWIGTPSRGLYLARPGKIQAEPIELGAGSPAGTGTAIVAGSGAAILALTSHGAFVQTAGAKAFREVENFPRCIPVAISNVGNDGEFWVALEVGTGPLRLGRIDPAGARWRWSLVSVEGFSDVGSIQDLHVERRADQEELWISGTEGTLRATPRALVSHLPPPPVVRLRPSGPRNSGSADSGAAIAFDRRALRAEFASIDFGRRDPDRFETILDGAETEWQAPDQSAQRDLAGLREGQYRLRVRLLSEAGEIGPEAAISFTIMPPWWRSAWLYAAGLAITGLLTAFLLRQRTRALRRRAAELEQVVRQRTAELERANAAKTDFVASMSHEIRNPMGGILSSALQLADSPLNEEQHGLVTTLSNCARFLAKLVEDVLDFAAIESGAYQIDFAPFSPREVLETAVSMLRPTAAGRELTIHVDEDLPATLVGDAGRIQQVIVNFTANALKFGGLNVRLSARRDGQFCLFAVADDGPGIPPAEQELLFVRFSRLKAARNSAIPGAGLGLAVSRELAQRMGGAVGVVSHPGHGALFYLRLPLRTEGLDGPRAGGRALIVEDVAYNARALAFMLKRLGYTCEIAATGGQALRQLQSTRYDAVFIDCDVPEISGPEIARRYRAAEAPPRVLIVATTALVSAENEANCRQAGMDRFLAKPVTPEKLRQVLAATPTEATFGAEGREPNVSLLTHLTDGSTAAIKQEIGKYAEALAEALAAVSSAVPGPGRGGVIRAAHRVLSLARLTNAGDLAEAALDLQDFGTVLTPGELAAAIAALRRAGETVLESLTASPAGGSPDGPSSPSRRYPGPSSPR